MESAMGGRMMGRRITVRLKNEGYEKLSRRSQETNLDFSFIVRDALGRYLDGGSAESGTATPAGSHGMPREAFMLAGPYRAWSGDLRVELRKRILELIAVAHVTAGYWPKTKGIREVYAGLLGLCHHLGIGEGVRQ
jgi:hypothetical protein